MRSRPGDGTDVLSLMGATKELRRLWVAESFHNRFIQRGPRAGWREEHGLGPDGICPLLSPVDAGRG